MDVSLSKNITMKFAGSEIPSFTCEVLSQSCLQDLSLNVNRADVIVRVLFAIAFTLLVQIL